MMGCALVVNVNSKAHINVVSRSQTKYSVSFLTEGGHIWSDFDGRPEPSLGLSVLMDLKTTVGKSAEPNVVVCP